MFGDDARFPDTGRVFSFYRTHDTNNNDPILYIRLLFRSIFFLKIPMSAIKKSKEFRGLACILSRLNSLATYYSYKTWFACLLMSPRKAETINHIIFTIICSQLYQPVPKENFNVTTENVSRHPLCVMRTGIVDLVTIRTKKIVVCIHCLRLIYCVRACGSVDKELVSQS